MSVGVGNTEPLNVLAYAINVAAATGVAARQRGCVIGRTAQGIYTVTLDPNIGGGPGAPAGECFVLVESRTPLRVSSVVHTSDTVKTITFDDAAGADQDCNFSVMVLRPAQAGL